MPVLPILKVTVTVELSERDMVNTLTSAWEGGIDNWCDAYNPTAAKLEDGFVSVINFASPDGDEVHDFLMIGTTTVGTKELAEAIGRVLNDEVEVPGLKEVLDAHFKEPENELDLSLYADALVQIACFNRVVYP